VGGDPVPGLGLQCGARLLPDALLRLPAMALGATAGTRGTFKGCGYSLQAALAWGRVAAFVHQAR